jgi:hypothetical protein
MINSILTSTKKVLGIDEDYTVFDEDIIMHINSVFMTLSQLGVGSSSGFQIEDDEAVWSDFVGADLNLNAVKTYIYLRVRLLFDPPTTSFVLTAMEQQIKELEWRLNVQVDPGDISIDDTLDGGPVEGDDNVFDGGSPSDPGSSTIYDGGSP